MTNKLNIILLLLFFACSSIQAVYLKVTPAAQTGEEHHFEAFTLQEHEYGLNWDTPVKRLRTIIAEKTGIPSDKQILLLAGSAMLDEDVDAGTLLTLADYKLMIEMHHEIWVTVRFPPLPL